MKQVNINQSTVWVSPKAEKMAYKLIGQLKIHRGRRLSTYLGLPEYYNNYDAVKLWVEEKLAEYSQDILPIHLQALFMDAVPSNLHGSIY